MQRSWKLTLSKNEFTRNVSLLQAIKKATYSILMLASLLATLIFSALAARIVHLFLIGMEEPTGNGSPMAFRRPDVSA